ncbi:MAG: 4-hydroxy-tetrahydrodipicolinate synthase [Oligoflexus sp.]
MSQKSLSGVMTAIITPFRQDGQIDWETFDRLLVKQEEAQVDGIVICGTTGEAPTLSVQEKLSLIRRARANVSRNIQIIAGTGGNDTQQSIELSRLAVDAGADALLVVTPPYNKPSPAGLQLHFRMIAEAVGMPIILYHVPGRTGQRLSALDMARICDINQVVAIKEASADLTLFSQTHRQTRHNVHQVAVLSGDDFTYLPSLAVGGEGVISVVTNIFPEAFVAMTRRYLEGDRQTALAIHEALLPFVDILFCESNPGPIKAALHMEGFGHNYLRPPLVAVNETSYQKIKLLLDETKDLLKTLV